MKKIPLLLAGLVLVTAHSAVGQDASGRALMSVKRRMDALAMADRVLAQRTPNFTQLVADLSDPFFRVNFAGQDEVAAPEEAPGRRFEHSDLDVLKGIAPGIVPTGTLLVGNEPYLLVGEKRLKVGDQISVTFDGLVYQVAVSSIERNSYTLRLNQHELRREFK